MNNYQAKLEVQANNISFTINAQDGRQNVVPVPDVVKTLVSNVIKDINNDGYNFLHQNDVYRMIPQDQAIRSISGILENLAF
jgi:hypothetical protein